MVAIAVVTIIPCLLALIYIGSSTVFEDVVSLSVSGLYASYFIPCTLLLWRRTTGQILDRSSLDSGNINRESPTTTTTTTLARTPEPSRNQSIADDDAAIDDVIRPVLVWGPWRVPGIWGTLNNAFACVFITFVIFWSFWPPTTPATPENMNYSVLVTGTVVAFSIVYYYLWGRTQYKGPLVEREVRGMVRDVDWM